MNNLAIGIFDSGMGGISVLAEMMKLMPNENYIYFGDSYNAPYGSKTKEEVKKYSSRACDFLINKGVKAIVVACNTATSASIQDLRNDYSIPIIGMEPALKPAIEMHVRNNIIVMATEMTLKESKFDNLVKSLDHNENIIKMPCPKLVDLVEKGIIDELEVKNVLDEYFLEIDKSNIGAIVLGCTHFVFLKDIIKNYTNAEIIIDGNKGTANNLKNILETKKMLNNSKIINKQIQIFNSSKDSTKIDLSKKLLLFQSENLINE